MRSIGYSFEFVEGGVCRIKWLSAIVAAIGNA